MINQGKSVSDRVVDHVVGRVRKIVERRVCVHAAGRVRERMWEGMWVRAEIIVWEGVAVRVRGR